jgi:hypothetical protein
VDWPCAAFVATVFEKRSEGIEFQFLQRFVHSPMNFFTLNHLAMVDAPGSAKTLWLPYCLSGLGPIQKRTQTKSQEA